MTGHNEKIKVLPAFGIAGASQRKNDHDFVELRDTGDRGYATHDAKVEAHDESDNFDVVILTHKIAAAEEFVPLDGETLLRRTCGGCGLCVPVNMVDDILLLCGGDPCVGERLG